MCAGQGVPEKSKTESFPISHQVSPHHMNIKQTNTKTKYPNLSEIKVTLVVLVYKNFQDRTGRQCADSAP